MTKIEINYRLPDRCCANCAMIYFNYYGDCCCKSLKHEDTVERGGVCDNHAYNSTSVNGNSAGGGYNHNDKIVLDPRQLCITCEHSYNDGNGTPRCYLETDISSDLVYECDNYKRG